MIRRYMKKPIVIEAVQWNGLNKNEVKELCKDSVEIMGNTLIIITLEGKIQANENDYITKGINNEVYPCKPDIFEKTYDLVD